MNFVGIDPGLTAPAVCVMDDGGAVRMLRTIRTGRLRGQERVRTIIRGVAGVTEPPCLVSIEAYAYSKRTQGQNAAIEAVGVLKYTLWRQSVPVIQAVGPMTLKKYLTGSGKAEKRDMIEAAVARGVRVIDDNQADAWGLAVILRDAYLYVTKGVKPTTFYQAQVCEELSGWIREHLMKGAVENGG